jgi:hypothetical protein
MVALARCLLVAVLSMLGVGVLGQELVIFTDNRALQVQSHRVDGEWTYLRIGSSGEMAVPSASILRVDNERVSAHMVAPVMPSTPVRSASSPAPQPGPDRSEAVRRPTPPPVVAEEPEDDEEAEDNSEMDEPEPPEPPAKEPDVQQQNQGMPQNPGFPQNPGLNQTPPGMPPRPGVFIQQQPPGSPPQKPVDDDD